MWVHELMTSDVTSLQDSDTMLDAAMSGHHRPAAMAAGPALAGVAS